MNILERFFSKVQVSPNGCWEWVGAVSGNGYGNFYVEEGRWSPAHRFIWETAHGKITDGLLVCHTCDNKTCVNPAHLFLGTHEDNMKDMNYKGRRASGSSVASYGNAKITRDEAEEIRIRYLSGGITQRELSEHYPVTQQQISRITRNVEWKE